MGASIGAQLVATNHEVLWWPPGRGQATSKRAGQAGLRASTVREDWQSADYIVSICPPDAAESVTQFVLDLEYRGTFVEANAISPMRSIALAHRLHAAGIRCLDASVIGGPVWPGQGPSISTIACAGHGAEAFASLFASSGFDARVVSDQVGDASSLKMVFAALTKGSTALIAEILHVAEQLGVRSELETLWGEKATATRHQQVITNAAKAWRFAGEMDEISETFAQVGAQSGFHQSAAHVFRRLQAHKDWTEAPDIAMLLESLAGTAKAKC
jgi:3-hydroxyisobutyrate dehydrogenase-like beta-hydroxyacid dehydrogenase